LKRGYRRNVVRISDNTLPVFEFSDNIKSRIVSEERTSCQISY
jgi:hypothetical protein